MPGKNYQASLTSHYRFSINGQEKESDLNENTTTALYWEYDSRIGRRWNVDPLVKTNESSYLCFGGNPIQLTDILGNTASDWVKDKNGKWVWKDEIKTPDQAKKAGYKDYKAPGSIVDNPDYNKVDTKTGIADGNKKIMLGKEGKIFVGILGLEVKSNTNPTLSDGHAWLALYDIEFKEKVLTFGLWPDNHKLVQNNGPEGSDIRTDIEKDRGDMPTSAYYQGITKEQQDLFYLQTKQNVAWKKTNTCANWARDCFEIVTKIHFETTETAMGMNIGTPRVLDKNISTSTKKGANYFPWNRGENDGGSSY